MRKRLLKKRVNVFVARAVSVNFALAHTRPSFWRLPLREQRRCLAWCIRNRLGVSRDTARLATRHWVPFGGNADAG